MITRHQIKELQEAGFDQDSLDKIVLVMSKPAPASIRQARWRAKKASTVYASTVDDKRLQTTSTTGTIGGSFLSSSKPLKDSSQVVVTREEVFPTGEDIDDAFDGWQCVAELTGLPKIKNPKNPGKDREIKMRARLRELGSLEALAEVLAKVRDSPHLRGESEGTWKGATIDWILKPTNMRKVAEGNYDKAHQKSHGGNGNGHNHDWH